MNTLLKELKNLKAKQKNLSDHYQKESLSVLQRIEQLEKLAQENAGVEVGTSIQIAVLKASQRRGYANTNSFKK